ncbi:AMP-binding protein [Nocardioides sp. MAH-18]|uniref:AMP-binding protein n=1 Tax=Nocardioides agri TaxID=2682843 RepID=A0A6L6XZX4_9ACTN|nr:MULTISPECIES: acyl-CoA synthetase [unclassified Nocardioides]MBA2956038.1 acyl-CoA synthetase [Nocardioides sp. CGMCC 1.13656]MVQ50885.1 AMP-binding protein [Nocardioides sp. MAH-18]
MYPGTWASRTPDKPALVMAGSGRTLTYAQLDERSARLARYLHDRAGLRVGDVVALLSDNRPETYEAYWAALRSGLYITAVNHNLAADEVAYILRDCGARALLVAPSKSDLAARAGVGIGTSLTFEGDYEEALAAVSAEPLPEQPHGEDLLYSSGTTGRPKGIKPPLPAIAVDEPGYVYPTVFGALYGFGVDTVYLSPAPVYHAAPLRFGGVVHALGGTLVMMERFDAEDALRAIERYRITTTQMVPTMFVRMLKLPPEVRSAYDVSSLRTVIHAAAPCPVDVKRAMIEWFGPIIHEYYASTEANGATFIDSEAWLRKPGSVGTALMGTIRICGDDGAVLGPGEVGTVFFEREQRTFSYHNDEERTRSTQHPDHESWTTVGDLGYLDEDGYLFLTDRKAFMIISGGVNIYPQEIEDLFSLHPAVTDIAVIGVPDDEMGERVVAFVQPAPGAVPGEDLAAELTAYARERIAHFKVPREFLFREELPRTPTGKMVKGRLREEYART